MATTMFFDEVVRDKVEKESMQIEFGRSSYYDGESLIYLNVDGKSVIMDEQAGRKLCAAVSQLASYLGYDR